MILWSILGDGKLHLLFLPTERKELGPTSQADFHLDIILVYELDHLFNYPTLDFGDWLGGYCSKWGWYMLGLWYWRPMFLFLKCCYSLLLFSYTEPTTIETTICLASRLWPGWRTHLHCIHFKKVCWWDSFIIHWGIHKLLGMLCLPSMYQVNSQLWHMFGG